MIERLYFDPTGKKIVGCDKSVTNVVIPAGVTSIGGGAFSDCTSLTSIEIPNSVTSIGYDAFSGCSSLTSIEIPDSVKIIGSGAFRGCTSLGVFSVSDNHTHFTVVGGVLFSKDLTELVSCPAGKQGDYEIPNSVTSIREEAFRGCTSLTSIEIPNSVTYIWSRAFYGCTSLTSIEIPNSVTYIWEEAFYGCTNLTEFHLRNEHPEDIEMNEYAFFDLFDCTLYVPVGTEDTYRHDYRFSFFKEIKTER